MCIFAEMICNACFLGRALEIFMKWSGRAGPRRQMNATMPKWLAGTPKRFFPRNSDVFQQPVVQLAEILPSLSAN